MTMPNFLIIGAQRAGTTSLYRYIEQHPKIYVSPLKEPQFFALEDDGPDFRGPYPKSIKLVTNMEAYLSLFRDVSDETAIGEGSTWYLYSQKAPERIRRNIANVKVVAMLRHPAERAYSNFLHCIRLGIEPLGDFVQAIREEDARVCNNWGFPWYYKRKGFYYSQLKRYFDKFDPSQIRVCLHDDFRAHPISIIQDVFRFLEVDDTFVPSVSVKYNVAPSVVRSDALHAFLNRRNSFKSIFKPFDGMRRLIVANLNKMNRATPKLQKGVRKELIKLYREDILELQDLIERDLSKWLD